MKRYFLLTTISSIFFIVSCKKDKNEPKPSQGVKVKTEKNLLANSEISYTYDTDGRIQKVENTEARAEYLFTPAAVTIKTTDLASNAVTNQTQDLDSAGRVHKSGSTTYHFNDNGYLQSYISTASGLSVTISYLNLNTKLSDSLRTVKNDIWERTVIYTYNLSVKQTLGNKNFGRQYLGESMPYAVKKIETWGPKSTPPFRELKITEEFLYGVDEQERIVRVEKKSNYEPNTVSVYNYY